MAGGVAAGHPLTAEAASSLLEAGGNAFDAVLAGLAAACVVEPVLASLGGGGFLLARRADGEVVLLDFFVQTPRRAPQAQELDFRPVTVDFGTAQQDFHIGMGSIATPGVVRGLFEAHRLLGTVPMPGIVEPAVAYARGGTPLNPLQAYILGIVGPIYRSTAAARRVYTCPGGRLLEAGDTLRQPELADALETLALEGDRLFYEGEMAAALVRDCAAAGGLLGRDDLRGYQAVQRRPLAHDYRGSRILTNPPPSSGGLLIAFAQELLAPHDLGRLGFGSPEHLALLARVMEQTNLARQCEPAGEDLLQAERVDRYRRAVAGHPVTARGTTHISVVDAEGNAAALSLSNGEGCGYLLPGTGIMVNNMLGEEDLNPAGFHCWPTDTRVSSMMAPTLAVSRERLIAVGSGGSNRLRTAILQVLCNLLDFGMDAGAAVASPRIHFERGLASIEPGFDAAAVSALAAQCPRHHLWQEQNLFFGGAHLVCREAARVSGAGDPRRGGVYRSA